MTPGTDITFGFDTNFLRILFFFFLNKQESIERIFYNFFSVLCDGYLKRLVSYMV